MRVIFLRRSKLTVNEVAVTDSVFGIDISRLFAIALYVQIFEEGRQCRFVFLFVEVCITYIIVCQIELFSRACARRHQKGLVIGAALRIFCLLVITIGTPISGLRSSFRIVRRVGQRLSEFVSRFFVFSCHKRVYAHIVEHALLRFINFRRGALDFFY